MEYIVGAKHDVSMRGHYNRVLNRAVIINLQQNDDNEAGLLLARISAGLERSWRAVQSFLVRSTNIAPPLLELCIVNTRAARTTKSIYETVLEDRFNNDKFASYIRIIASHAQFDDNIDEEQLKENETISLVSIEFQRNAAIRWHKSIGACAGKVVCNLESLHGLIIDVILDLCIANSAPIRGNLLATGLSLNEIYKRKVDFVREVSRSAPVAQDASYVSLSSIARQEKADNMELYISTSINLWLRFCSELGMQQQRGNGVERKRIVTEAVRAFPKARRGQVALAKLLNDSIDFSPGPYFLTRVKRKPSLKADRGAIVKAFGINVFRVGVVRLLQPSAFGQLTSFVQSGVVEYVKLVMP